MQHGRRNGSVALPLLMCLSLPTLLLFPTLKQVAGTQSGKGGAAKAARAVKPKAAGAATRVALKPAPSDPGPTKVETAKADPGKDADQKQDQPLVKEEAAKTEGGQTKATYVGVNNCVMCHDEVHKGWQKKPHARAFDLLVAKKADKTDGCLKCHTTGFGQGGYQDAEKTPGLKGVTCESCHGPGSEHNGDKEKITRVPPATVCAACHMKADIH